MRQTNLMLSQQVKSLTEEFVNGNITQNLKDKVIRLETQLEESIKSQEASDTTDIGILTQTLRQITLQNSTLKAEILSLQNDDGQNMILSLPEQVLSIQENHEAKILIKPEVTVESEEYLLLKQDNEEAEERITLLESIIEDNTGKFQLLLSELESEKNKVDLKCLRLEKDTEGPATSDYYKLQMENTHVTVIKLQQEVVLLHSKLEFAPSSDFVAELEFQIINLSNEMGNIKNQSDLDLQALTQMYADYLSPKSAAGLKAELSKLTSEIELSAGRNNQEKDSLMSENIDLEAHIQNLECIILENTTKFQEALVKHRAEIDSEHLNAHALEISNQKLENVLEEAIFLRNANIDTESHVNLLEAVILENAGKFQEALDSHESEKIALRDASKAHLADSESKCQGIRQELVEVRLYVSGLESDLAEQRFEFEKVLTECEMQKGLMKNNIIDASDFDGLKVANTECSNQLNISQSLVIALQEESNNKDTQIGQLMTLLDTEAKKFSEISAVKEGLILEINDAVAISKEWEVYASNSAAQSLHDLESALEKTKNLQVELDEYTIKLHDLQAKLTSSEETISRQVDLSLAQREELESLREKLLDLNETTSLRISDLNSQLAVANLDMQNYRNELESTRRNLPDLEFLQAAFDQLQIEFNQSQSQLFDKDATIQQLSDRIIIFNSDISQGNLNVDRMAVLNEAFKRICFHLGFDSETDPVEIVRLLSGFEGLVMQHEEQNQKIAILEESHSLALMDLKKQSDIVKCFESGNIRNDGFARELLEKEELINDAGIEMRSLREQLLSLQKQLFDAEAIINEWAAFSASLETERDEVTAECGVLTEQLALLKPEISQLQMDSKTSLTSVHLLEESLAEKTLFIAEYEEQIVSKN